MNCENTNKRAYAFCRISASAKLFGQFQCYRIFTDSDFTGFDQRLGYILLLHYISISL